MTPDLDLLRDVLLLLEQRQVSPRATVVIALTEAAERLEIDPFCLAGALSTLQDLGYIEGPGPEAANLWLFRKLTRKGALFVRTARRPQDWARMKQARGFAS